MAALNACLKPKDFNLSQKITVSFCPQYLKTKSMTSDICFFVNFLSTRENFMFGFLGSISARINLPAVLVCFS